MPRLLNLAQAFGSYLLKRNLQHMIVLVTNHCNFRCEHCYIDFSPKNDLSLTQLQMLGRSVGNLFWLDIGGGEPFLRKDLAEIIAAFRHQVVQIPTNGSLPELAIENLTRLKSMTPTEITVSLSLDGLQGTHEKIRGKKGNWDQVWSTFEKLRSLGGVSLKINTVITNTNVNEIIPLMTEVRRRKPDFHSIILLRGTPMQEQVALPPLTELRRLAPDIFAILGTYDYGRNPLSAQILRNYHRFLWKTSLATIEEKRQVIPCQAGKFHKVVFGDGSVSSCEMLPPIGNIRSQSWSDIMESDAFKKQLKSIEAGECHCTHNCAMLGSILFNPAQAIKLAKQTIE